MSALELRYNRASLSINPINHMTELAQARAAAAAELARIDADIAAAAKAQRGERIAQVRALMTEHGITLQDIGGKLGPQAPALRSVKPAAAPMYRNDAGLTWAGRGKRPGWLRDALSAGSTLDQFRIAA